MELEKSPVWADVRKIFADTEKPVRNEYTAMIHTVKENFPATKIVMIDIIRDYANNIGDVVMIEIVLLFGVYQTQFYPYRDNMELTVSRRRLSEAGEDYKSNAPMESERYKVVFLPDENPQLKSSDLEAVDAKSLDLVDVVTVKLQLMNRSLEPIRIKTVGGIYKNVLHADIIRGLVVGEANKILVEGKPSVDGMDLVPPDNKEKQRHVIVPHGTLVTSIPTFLQEKTTGVYNAGIGTYLQTYNGKQLWFVYPLYNTKRFKTNVKKVVFYAVPKNRFPEVERTYRKQGDVLYIAATSGKSYSDEGDTKLMSKGSGFRMADARSFMSKPVEVTTSGPVGKRSRLNHEVAVMSRKDSLNYVPVSDRDISSNPFVEYSRILQRRGGRIDVIWSNGDPKEIYPGMPCKFVSVTPTGVREQEGVVLFMHAFIQLDGEGVTAKAHRVSCQLSLFVEPEA